MTRAGRGRPADKRSDVWAFGCVLYEMLTGKRAFPGEDVTDTLAAIVRGEPDWAALHRDVPEPLRMLLRRCLEKDLQRRTSHISVARFLLAQETLAASAAASPPPSRRHRTWPLVAGALALGALLATGATWLLRGAGQQEPASDPAVRFTFPVRTGGELWSGVSDRPFAVSPDGRRIAYRGRTGDASQLFVRDVDALEPRALADTREPRQPFFSPDGE